MSARIIYYMLRDRHPYRPLTQEAFHQQRRARDLQTLRKLAAKLGVGLHPEATTA